MYKAVNKTRVYDHYKVEDVDNMCYQKISEYNNHVLPYEEPRGVTEL